MSEKEYIERGDAINIITMGISNAMSSERAIAYSDITRRINAIPSADVEPVVRGEWIEFDEDMNAYKCSACDEPYVLIDGTPEQNHYNYCPNCGSHMQEKPNE